MTFPLSLNALPSTYRSAPVLPFAPNRRADRSHSWDAPIDGDTIPSGLSIVSQHVEQGQEFISLGFDGLSRSNAKAIEDFVLARKGRAEGFWCPTFQHDFYAVARSLTSTWPGGQVGIRDWSYVSTLYNLGVNYRRVAAYRGGTVGGAWYLAELTATGGSSAEDGTSNTLYAYDHSGTGNADVIGNSNSNGVGTGLVLMRLLWVRCADDALTTEWAHPNHATITLRVVSITDEAP